VVTKYGADPTGSRDSTSAIRDALSAAEQTPGATVYFPAGRYLLDQKTKGDAAFVLSEHAVNLLGAGASRTTIVQEVGAKNGYSQGQGIFEIRTGGNGQPGGGDGSTISGLTLDSATYDGGTTILDFGNNTTISDDVILGPRSSHDYNKDQFGLRVLDICNHTNLATHHHGNNTVRDLRIVGRGNAGAVDLDISCQENDTVSNVTDTGNGVALYIDRGVTLDGLTFHPGPIAAGAQPYIVTPPASNLLIEDVTTYGSGGRFQSSPKGYMVSASSIVREQMLGGPSTTLRVGDVEQLRIEASKLEAIQIIPSQALDGITVVGSSVGPIQCLGPGRIAGLQGVTCS
jgi:hypothetical protein